MSEPLTEREKEIMEEHKKHIENIVENYEFRLKDRWEYENVLKDDIAKKEDKIQWLTSLVTSLSAVIVIYFITLIFFT